jgi:endo-1,4-beta-xylanase
MHFTRSILACSVVTFALFGCAVEAGDENLGSEQSDLTLTTNQTGTNNGFYYQYWADTGHPTMDLGASGQWDLSWQSGTYDFVGGKGWKPGSARTINYNAGVWNPGSSNAWLAVYGWFTNPLVEYYIVDTWGSWRPTMGTQMGTVTCDGAAYDVWKNVRTNAPNITGTNQNFDQWWSIRQTKRATGANVTITTSCHFNYWKTKGFTQGSFDEQLMATEVYNPASSGSMNLTVW